MLFVMGFIQVRGDWLPARDVWLPRCRDAQVVYEINITQTLTFPMYGAARPTAHLLLIFVGFFVNSHSCFRWLVLFGQLLFIVFDTLSVAYVATLIDCKQDNTCLSEDGWDEQQLRVIEARHYICIFVEIWSVLIIGYLMAVIGLCRPRYPVRLFSTSQPLASLPASRTQYGRIASANAKLETV